MEPRSPCPRQPTQPEHIRLRRLAASDCLNQLTGMLHRAFARLGDMGIPCAGANQSSEMTRHRIAGGECFVAVCGEQVVGTITLYSPDTDSDSLHYRSPRVASLRQLCVDPRHQGKGIGAALLALAATWARRHGYARLALDTPEPARHLVEYYRRQGFHAVETLQFQERAYRSVVFSCVLFPRTSAEAPWLRTSRRVAVQQVRPRSPHSCRLPCPAVNMPCVGRSLAADHLRANPLPRKRR